jgi:DNA-directed RNA polymerase III subunit RPC11
MLFCPYCSNFLVVEADSSTGKNAWICNTCAYQFPIKTQVSALSEGGLKCEKLICIESDLDALIKMVSRTKLKRKEVDDVLGGEDMWKDASSTTGVLLLPR